MIKSIMWFLTFGPIVSACLCFATSIGCAYMGRYVGSVYWLSACMLNVTLYMLTVVGMK